MKKSILSNVAVALLSGLGIASTASAVAIFDSNTAPTYVPYRIAAMKDVNGAPILVNGSPATLLEQHPAGTGHILLVPYFSAQGTAASLINIVNTDLYNGKAVKVRLRGASNSDDLLDFTLLMSPGDVWAGMVAVGSSTGSVTMSLGGGLPNVLDTTCTLPDASQWPTEVHTTRFPGYLSGVQTRLESEGYIEVLNMADIPPFLSNGTTANPLFTAIKHVNGKAPCSSTSAGKTAIDKLLTLDEAGTPPGMEASYIDNFGLAFPTGSLMGSWAVLNQGSMSVVSGAANAVIGTTENVGRNGTAVTRATGIAFAPQREEAYYGTLGHPSIDERTADPLLVAGTNHVGWYGGPAANATGGVRFVEEPLWYDLPDLSTPLLTQSALGASGATDAPAWQATLLTETMLKRNIMNEWMSAPTTASVPSVTDWVVSQPTRRYHVAVKYGTTTAAGAQLVFGLNPDGGGALDAAGLFGGYNDAILEQNYNGFGPMACLRYGFSAADREEGLTDIAAAFSPGKVAETCGEVFTMQFGTTSLMQSQITAFSVKSYIDKLAPADTGWAVLNVSTPSANGGTPGSQDPKAYGLPALGYQATQFTNRNTNGIYNVTNPHRWQGVAN